MSTRTSRQHHTDFSNYPFKAGDIAYCKDRPDVLEDDGRVSEAYPARPVILVRENPRHAHHWEVMFFTLNEKVDTQGFPSSSLLPYDDGYSKFESVRLWNKPRPEHEKEYMEAVGWEVEQAAKAHKDRQPLPPGMRQVLDAATVKEKSESSGARARVRTRSRSSSRRTASLDRSASPKARSRSPVYAGSSRVRGHTPPDEHSTRHSRRTHGSFKPGDLYRATITRMLPESDIYMPEAGSRALPIDSSPSNSSAVATSSKTPTEETPSPPEDLEALRSLEAKQSAELVLYEEADRAYEFLMDGKAHEEFIQRFLQSAAFVFGGDESDSNEMGVILAGIRLALRRIQKESDKFDLPNMRRLSLALYQILRPAGFGDLRGSPKLFSCAALVRSIVKDMIGDVEMG
ncbi:hypothetical protein FOZ61_008515 [Perkinsus olseni]|uniref:Uncharacterized protein n=1 Tax=Perkinsus olseni TaxID=32597 RepID=A0A7J6M6X0_PEROL|nr:hypothetical protein FOZ61_008515 [Perkinsus olseni]